MKKLISVAALIWSLNAITATMASDWPQWRGPNNNGASAETGLPAKWSPTENIKWRIELPGPAPSTPVVWGDRIFLTSADGSDLVVMCASTDGKLLWKKVAGAGNDDIRQGESNAAASSPVTDGKNMWAFFGTGVLVCYDFAGNEVWKFDVQSRYKKFNLYWGMATSPLLDGDRLYLLLLHTNTQSVVALNKNTGAEIWHHQRKTDAYSESLHSYASPIMYRHNGIEFLVIHGADYVTGHSLKDGSEIWRSGGLQSSPYNPLYRFVATPAAAPGLLVVPSAKGGPVLGINPDGAKGLITESKTHLRWQVNNLTPDVPSPLIHDGLVYLCRENGQIICVDDKSGDVIYQERGYNKRHRASPVYADGKVYVIAMDGTVTVVKAGRQFDMLSQNSMNEQTAASLAIANGTIYMRTYEALYAIAK
jgi:outer membrane protein assembly factor BamB